MDAAPDTHSSKPDPLADLPLFRFAAQVVPTGRADGAVLVIPGKPVALEAVVTVTEAVLLLGRRYSRSHVQRIFRGRNRHRGCKLLIPVRELEKLRPRA